MRNRYLFFFVVVVMNDKAHKDTESNFMKGLSILYNECLDIDI